MANSPAIRDAQGCFHPMFVSMNLQAGLIKSLAFLRWWHQLKIRFSSAPRTRRNISGKLLKIVLADIAVSGASLERRHMLRSLIAAAEKRPRPFNRVLIADTARLTRNMEDCLYILKHFTDHDIRIVDISQGLDLSEIAARLGFPNTRARIPRHGKPSLTQ